MKALDRDVRERILRAVERGEPMPSVAARFEVGYSTVKKLKYRQRDTGSTEPLTSRCGRKRVIDPEQGSGSRPSPVRAAARWNCCGPSSA